MSDPIQHECGIALLRLKKPLRFYQEKYKTSFYGLEKLYLLMEKQHNRGQDGAGIANIKFDVAPGHRYISRIRSNEQAPIQDAFTKIHQHFENVPADKLNDPDYLKEHHPFTGELFLGHLRYGTFGKNRIENCHPFLRQNNWMTRNLVLAGNFNLTNVKELFVELTKIGQHPKELSDTVTMLENIGHYLDRENDRLFDIFKDQDASNQEISHLIAKDLDVGRILRNSSHKWDGGYAMVGLFGHGDAFVLRDPSGIRPAFYYEDDEVFVCTSERPVIQTAFQAPIDDIKEVPPGHAIILKKNEATQIEQFTKPLAKTSCTFERIYFSRGSDADIYNERKRLGKSVLPKVLDEIDHNIDDTVFSFIPNTAETSFFGMIEGIHEHLDEQKATALEQAKTKDEMLRILSTKPRVEKIAVKDAKLRTFISEDSGRDEIVAHVYDVTYGIIRENKDNLVVVDDSIVRGTTLKKSILRILGRLSPKKIVVVSSAPQIRYPDCYGIDMAKIHDFIAFQAAIELLKDHGMDQTIQDVYQRCQNEDRRSENFVKAIYEPFTDDQVSKKIAEMLTPENLDCDVSIIYQTVQGLHQSIQEHAGDWYFTGTYPTPGGNLVVNQAFVNFIEGTTERAYA